MNANTYELYIETYTLFRTGNYEGGVEIKADGEGKVPLAAKCAAALAVSDARDDEDPASYTELKMRVDALLDSIPEAAV